MNDEMFRLSLIELMNEELLNDFVNKIFKYRLKDGQYVYMQYKIVNSNVILNIYDNGNVNRFKAYIFTNNDIKNNEKDVYFINVEDCYKRYKNKETRNRLVLLGALLKEENNEEKRRIINYIDKGGMRSILLKHFIS